MSAFWNAWRKEIIRGTLLFAVVLGVGLCVWWVIARVREGVTHGLPLALQELRSNFDPQLLSGPRHAGETWTYHARVTPRQWVWIRNVNGSVTVEAGKGDSLAVSAVKSYRRSDPASVRLVAVPFAGGVTVCAVWPGNEDYCAPGGDFHPAGSHGNDVAVDFTVHLPRGVALGASTVLGAVRVNGASAPLVAQTVSGDVDAATAEGPVTAIAVNGSVHARMSAFGDTGSVSLFTVNGSVTAELPAHLDADVVATTVNGGITSDYPITASGSLTSRRLRGTVGAGGRTVHITTVNGSIILKKAGEQRQAS